MVKKRVIDGIFSRRNRSVLARGFTRSHHGLTHFQHDSADISKVQINKTGLNHQVSNAADTLMKYSVRH